MSNNTKHPDDITEEDINERLAKAYWLLLLQAHEPPNSDKLANFEQQKNETLDEIDTAGLFQKMEQKRREKGI